MDAPTVNTRCTKDTKSTKKGVPNIVEGAFGGVPHKISQEKGDQEGRFARAKTRGWLDRAARG